MALASVGARTPFITRTPSNAVIFASPAVEVTFRLGLGLGLELGFGLGLATAELPSVLLAFAVFSVAVFASLFSAITGISVIAIRSRADNHLFTSNIDGVLLIFSVRLGPGTKHGAERYFIFYIDVKIVSF